MIDLVQCHFVLCAMILRSGRATATRFIASLLAVVAVESKVYVYLATTCEATSASYSDEWNCNFIHQQLCNGVKSILYYFDFLWIQQIHNKRGDASDQRVAALVVLLTSPTASTNRQPKRPCQ